MNRRSKDTTAPATGPQVISDLEAYPLREAARRMRWGTRLTCQLQDAGLATFTVGRVKYILGEDILAFFRKARDEQQQAAQPGAGASD
jgi:hypothetical protein